MKPSNFRISVVITSYNQKDYLVEAIESVLNQTLKPFEIIIVDDCSVDDSQEIIEKYARTHAGLIRPFYHKQNLGYTRNKNFALRRVQGDLVTCLDGDDRFLPKKLEMELETLINNPEAPIVYSNTYYIDSHGRRIGSRTDRDTLQPSGHVFRAVFSRDCPSTFSNELVIYACLLKVGFLDERFPMYADWDMKLRLTKHFMVTYCPEILVEYRRHPGGVTSRTPPPKRLSFMKRVYKKNLPLLNDLSQADRRLIKSKLSAIFSSLAEGAAREAMQKGHWNLAVKYWLEYSMYNPRGFSHKVFRWTCTRMPSLKMKAKE